jgi:hypothetical protein
MVLSKRQKILAVALGLAAAVFLADRILLEWDDLGPSKAGAWPLGNLDVEPLVPKGLLPAASACEVARENEVTLADRLEQAVEDGELDPMAVKDAFRPTESWSGLDLTERFPLGSAEAIAEAFAGSHRLSATAVSADGGMAIIDGQCLAVGRELDGFRLISVTRNSAVLGRGTVKVTLTLSNETPTSARD